MLVPAAFQEHYNFSARWHVWQRDPTHVSPLYERAAGRRTPVEVGTRGWRCTKTTTHRGRGEADVHCLGVNGSCSVLASGDVSRHDETTRSSGTTTTLQDKHSSARRQSRRRCTARSTAHDKVPRCARLQNSQECYRNDTVCGTIGSARCGVVSSATR
jgi:hypothetical protein